MPAPHLASLTSTSPPIAHPGHAGLGIVTSTEGANHEQLSWVVKITGASVCRSADVRAGVLWNLADLTVSYGRGTWGPASYVKRVKRPIMFNKACVLALD
jgi:hypothetical protein